MSFNLHHFLADSERAEKYKKRYLFLYNTIQTFGWSYILIQFLNGCLNKSPDKTLYEEVKWPLTFFQTGAVLEYYHALFKLTKSSPTVTFQQLYSRVFIVWLILFPIEDAQTNIGFPMLLLAWSITEIIRYSNYALATYNQAPYFLVWLRYTLFTVLYPLGVSGELLCMYWAVEELKRTKQWTIEFPNKWNVMFYFHHYIIFTMILYIPFFPPLYMHMIRQRRKVLGTNKKKDE